MMAPDANTAEPFTYRIAGTALYTRWLVGDDRALTYWHRDGRITVDRFEAGIWVPA